MKRAAKAHAKREAKQARRNSRTDAADEQVAAAEDEILQDSPQQDASADEASKD